MKKNIIRIKAGELNLQLPDDVVEYISSNVGSNISEIDGALTSIVAYTELYRPAISLETAKKALKDVIS